MKTIEEIKTALAEYVKQKLSEGNYTIKDVRKYCVDVEVDGISVTLYEYNTSLAVMCSEIGNQKELFNSISANTIETLVLKKKALEKQIEELQK